MSQADASLTTEQKLNTLVAVMSRPVAGIRNKSLILTLPGSPKGAKENLQSVLKLLAHACQQAAGADSRIIHAGGVEKLEKEAGVSATAHAGAAPRYGCRQLNYMSLLIRRSS